MMRFKLLIQVYKTRSWLASNELESEVLRPCHPVPPGRSCGDRLCRRMRSRDSTQGTNTSKIMAFLVIRVIGFHCKSSDPTLPSSHTALKKKKNYCVLDVLYFYFQQTKLLPLQPFFRQTSNKKYRSSMLSMLRVSKFNKKFVRFLIPKGSRKVTGSNLPSLGASLPESLKWALGITGTGMLIAVLPVFPETKKGFVEAMDAKHREEAIDSGWGWIFGTFGFFGAYGGTSTFLTRIGGTNPVLAGFKTPFALFGVENRGIGEHLEAVRAAASQQREAACLRHRRQD